MRKLFSFITMILATACSGLTESERAILRACGTLDPDYDETVQAAYRGEINAIDCRIAVADRSLVPDAYYPGDSVGWRYIRWLETGEQPEDIFKLAMTSTRRELDLTAFPIYLRYAEEHNEMPSRVFRLDGCMYRPLKYDRLWQAANPNEGSDQCDNMARAHLDH